MLMNRYTFFIFLFLIPAFINAQQLEPTETNALLNVIVSSLDDKPRAGDVISLTGQMNKKTFSGITDAKGKFSVLIPEGDTYIVKYKIFGGEEKSKQVSIPSQEGNLTYQLDIKYDPPKVFTLENVFFDTGKSTLRPESFKTLNDLAEVMKLKPTMVIEIAGHTDNVGTPESNLKLSFNRANSVKNYLVNHGIAAVRITTQGYGDTQPVASNDSDDGRQKNRRTVVHIIKE